MEITKKLLMSFMTTSGKKVYYGLNGTLEKI